MTSREAEIQAWLDTRVGGDWTRTCADLAYLLVRVATLEAQVAAVREAVDDCPPCEVHPDGDPVTCGWKYAVADVRAALDSAATS